MKKLISILAVAAMLIFALSAAVSAAELQNYCKKATILEVSAAADANPAANAIDGKSDTFWASGKADTANIVVDLGKPMPVGYIQIIWGDDYAVSYGLGTSSDAEAVAGTDIYESKGGTDEITLESITTMRCLNFELYKPSGSNGFAIKEIVIRRSADATEAAVTGYPSSGVTPPDGSFIIKGELIGLEEGWGGNADAGRAAAFDGDINTYFDPLGTGDGYAGVDAGEQYTLTYIAIHPRDGQIVRFDGAEINGSNDGENWELIWISEGEAEEWTWQKISADQFKIQNPTFRYFRYFNEFTHGDVGEVELYGVPVDGTVDWLPVEEEIIIEEEAPAAQTPAADAPAAEAAPEAAPAEAPAAPAAAPQTSDTLSLVIAAAVTAFGSAVIVSKKRK